MFFTNDPWWGALHANDGILAMPIFWEGAARRLVGDRDARRRRRQPDPRQLRLAAPPTASARRRCFPGSRWSRTSSRCVDVERAYLRNSRVPEHNALNMRARVAALRSTYQRIGELIERVRTRGLPRRPGGDHRLRRARRALAPARDPRRRVVLDGLPRPRRQQQHLLPDLRAGHQARRPPRRRPDRDVAAGARARSTARSPCDGGGDHRRDPDVPLLRPAVGDRARCATSSRSSPSRARSTTR